MGAGFQNPSAVHNDNHIRVLDGGNPLGDNQLGGAGDFLPEGLADHGIGVGVHGGGGVVQNQDFRLFQQGPGDAQPLLLAAGDIGAALLDVGIVALREALDEFVGAGQAAGMNQLLIGGLGVAPAQIFLDGAGEQGVLLEHHGHVVPQNLQVIVPDIHAAHLQRAPGDIVQPGNQLHQGGLGGAGGAQNAHGGPGGNVEIHMLQGVQLGLLGVAEGHILKIDGAVLHVLHRLFGGGEVGRLRQNLRAPAHGGPGHNHHHEHHGEHHQAGENLGGVGEHGAELAGGHPRPGQIAGGDDHFRAEPGDEQNAGVDAQLHNGVAQRQDVLRLGEQPVDLPGGAGEFLHLLFLPDEALHHPDPVDILLHHIVQRVVGLEHLVENLEHQGHQPKEHQHQQRQGDAVHQAQLHADAHGGDQGQRQHHRAADGHADHHLEGVLDVGHIGGQPGDNGGGGEFVDVGEAEFLDMVVHVMAQVLGEARPGLGGENRRSGAEAQGGQGADHQQQGLTNHNRHILHDDAVVIELGHHQGDQHLHGHLADHADGAENGGPFVFPDAPGKTFYHSWVSSSSNCNSG